MRRDLTASLVAMVALTLLLGVAYPLVVTGIAQVAFPGRADGSRVERDGRLVGSTLIGQDFRGVPRYFQSRPSATGYAADATAFSDAGPNSRALRDAIRRRAQSYLRRERAGNPGLSLATIPADAVMSSAPGLAPHIPRATARIQAARVAATRGIPEDRVMALV